MGPLTITDITARDFAHAVVLSGILLGVMFLVLAVYYFLIEPLKKRRKVAQRLTEVSQEHFIQLNLLRERLDSRSNPLLAFFKTVLGKRKLARLQRQLLQADILWDPAGFLVSVLLSAIFGFFSGSLALKNLAWAVALASGTGFLPFWYIRRKKKQKTMQFEAQMPDAMELLARSLRAGHTLPSAIELLSGEVGHPLGTEMRVAYEEQHFGISMPDALAHMLERVDSPDLKYFITAVLIQQDTGGNLVEIMEKISSIIRSRLNFKIKIRALTADGRLSATILTLLPICMFFILMLIRPEYELVLIREPFGRTLLLIGVIIILTGTLVMRKMIKAIEA